MTIRLKPAGTPAPSPLQLKMALDSVVLQAMNDNERARAVAALANLLLLAAGMPAKEHDDDDQH